MQSLYWRSNYVSTRQLVAVALLAIGGLYMVEAHPVEELDPLRDEKTAAARLCEEAFRTVSLERIRLSIPLDTEVDPAGSGLLGPAHTPIVSNEGHLSSKRTTANPNFAAAFVEMLHEAEVDEGDHVAVNLTGSFPAMNIAMYAALETLGAVPVVVSSVAASEYGATNPTLTWLDMEALLFERDIFSFRSAAASLGGVLDIGRNHTEEGRTMLRAAIARNELPLLSPEDFEDAVRLRLNIFESERPSPVAFINVGGGTASVGTADDKRDYRPGLNTRVPRGLEQTSVMRTFLERGIPVIHISKIRSLARQYGLEDEPMQTPAVGEGEVYRRSVVQPWTLIALLLVILLAMFGATRFDLAAAFRKKAGDKRGPEQMV